MSVGPAEILIILVVALLVFGPQRLPEVGRQVGSALRELRKMQDTVRGELDMVLHPEHGTKSSSASALEPDDHSVVDADVTGNADDNPSGDNASDDHASDDHPSGDWAGDSAPGVSDTGDVTSIAVESTDDQGVDDRGFSGPSDSFI